MLVYQHNLKGGKKKSPATPCIVSVFKAQHGRESSSPFCTLWEDLMCSREQMGDPCAPLLTVRWQERKVSGSLPRSSAHWPSVVCVKQNPTKQQSDRRPPSIFALCGLQTIPNDDAVGFLNETCATLKLGCVFNIFLIVYLINTYQDHCCLSELFYLGSRLESTLHCILNCFTDFFSKSDLRKNRVRLHLNLK